MSKAIVGASLAAFLALATAAPGRAQVSTTPGSAISAESTTTAAVVSEAPQSFVVRAHNQEVALASQPLRVGADIYVPLRESLAAVGAQNISFNPSTGQLSYMLNGQQGMIDVRTQQSTLGGSTISMPGPLRMVNGTYYVRSEFLSSIDPTFQVTRVAVAGFRGGVGFPPASQVTSFSYGGNTLNWNNPTFYEGGVLMVPLTDTLSSLGVQNTFQPGDLQITFPWNGQNVLLNVTSGYAYVGNQQWILDRPVSVYQDVPYVPASFFARLVPGFAVQGEMRLNAGPGAVVPETGEVTTETTPTGGFGVGAGK